MNPILELWPHQEAALDAINRAIRPGRGLCVTAPTGSGKSVIMFEMLRQGARAVLYTHRRMLLDQLSENLSLHGIQFGVRAAGYEPDPSAPIQLASIQTDDSRVVKNDRWSLHRAELVIVDEAHSMKGRTACEIFNRYKEQGAAILGFTATPLGIGGLYDRLIAPTSLAELRAQGIIVRAEHFAPDEPDLKHIKRTKTGEYKQADVVKAIMTHSIFGRVIDHWRMLNPTQKPTLLFAPGVKESMWFAEQFTKAGITAAHIDGNNIVICGKRFESDTEGRQALRELSRRGELKIICNRFVMREGIDFPWLYHCIFATMIGSLTSYIQAGGRMLRSHPGKDHCIIQDHGGMWHRLGSLNSDREWELDQDDYTLAESRIEELRTRKEPEPIVCPQCHYLRLSGPKCPHCGFEHTSRSRMVIQANGALNEVFGDIYKPRRVDRRPGVEARWEKIFWRFRNSKSRTFAQARAYYAKNHFWTYVPEGCPYTPKDVLDWYRPVNSVPLNRLHLPVSDGVND